MMIHHAPGSSADIVCLNAGCKGLSQVSRPILLTVENAQDEYPLVPFDAEKTMWDSTA